MEQVTLHDVRDVTGFVVSTVLSLNLHLTADHLHQQDAEREELQAEGLALMFELAEKWDGRGRFAGYAAAYLPKRLIEAWHRMHREHTRGTLPDGRREWRYGPRPESLNMVTSETHRDADVEAGDARPRLQIDPRSSLGAAHIGDPAEFVGVDNLPLPTYIGTPVHMLMADQITQPVATPPRFNQTVRSALRESMEQEVDLHLRVSLMAASGLYTRKQIGAELGLAEDELRAIFARLRRCAHLLDPAQAA